MDYRSRLQEQAALQLSRAEAALLEERQRLEELRRDLVQQLGIQREVGKTRGKIEAWRLSSVAMVVGAVREQIGLQRRIILEAEGEVAARREMVVQARKDHRSLELLRDRDQQRWQGEQDRIETQELDEIFAHRLTARGGATTFAT